MILIHIIRSVCLSLRAGCTLHVKDFKASWRSGVVFLAILCALRPDVVSLSKARSQSNRQNLEEAFHIAERELHIPRLLDPAGVCLLQSLSLLLHSNTYNTYLYISCLCVCQMWM